MTRNPTGHYFYNQVATHAHLDCKKDPTSKVARQTGSLGQVLKPEKNEIETNWQCWDGRKWKQKEN